jgi:hypothetical protein
MRATTTQPIEDHLRSVTTMFHTFGEQNSGFVSYDVEIRRTSIPDAVRTALHHAAFSCTAAHSARASTTATPQQWLNPARYCKRRHH